MSRIDSGFLIDNAGHHRRPFQVPKSTEVMIFVKLFLQQSGALIRRIYIPFLILTILTGSLDQWFSLTLESELRSPEGASGQVWLWAFLSIVNSLLGPWLMSLVALLALRPEMQPSLSETTIAQSSRMHFFNQFAEQNLIESLRAWGKCLIYSLFLILPGIWKFFEYSLVPWVVCFDPQYQRGEIDALQASARFFRKSWFRFLLVILFFSLVIPLLMTSFFEENRMLWVTPLPALVLHAADAFLHLIFFQILTVLFFRLLKREDSNELAL